MLFSEEVYSSSSYGLMWMSIKFNSEKYNFIRKWKRRRRRRNNLLLSISECIIYFSLLINSSTKFNDKIFSARIFCWIFAFFRATHHVTALPRANKTERERIKFFPTLTRFLFASTNVNIYGMIVYVAFWKIQCMYLYITPEFSAINMPKIIQRKFLLYLPIS